MILGVVISLSNSTTSTTHPVGAYIQESRGIDPFSGRASNHLLRHFAVVHVRSFVDGVSYGLITGIYVGLAPQYVWPDALALTSSH